MRHAISRIPVLLSALALLLALPSSTFAGSYWWTGTSAAGQIAQGVNGFSWHMNGGSFNTYGSHCDARPATYPAGSYCYLRWDVPANLTAGTPGNGGILYGRVRTANANFSLRTTRPGANPDYTSTLAGPLDMRDYGHGWGALGTYVQTGIYTTAATTPTSTTNWFDVNEFAVVLHDPHNPGLNILSGHSGWKGPGGACIRYGYGEAGSGLQATALTNASTGVVYDNPSYASANVTTGVFQNDRNCVSVGALPTGHYTFRASAVDKSGNGASNDFTVSFDTTQPSMSNIVSGSTAVSDGRVFAGSGEGYRPGFSISVSDAHSGLASVQAFLDGTHVANAASYTPPSNLTLGTHTIMFRATDAVGNQAQVSRTFVVVDDIPPTVTVAQPAANGSNEPILDVSATDDHSGVKASTWTVSVNGVQLPSSATMRLQMNLGRVANGTHTIVVRVSDNAGNERTTTIEHVANKDTYTPPNPTGLFSITSPLVVYEGGSFHLVALAVKDGRPLAGQRFELLPPGSTTAIAGKNATADGSVDLLVEHAIEGPLRLTMPGSGLEPITIEYTFHKKSSQPYCNEHPTDTSCQTVTGGGNDGGGTSTGGTGGGGSGATDGSTGGTTGGAGGATNVGTSGTAADKVPPKVSLRIAAKTKPGVVRRTRQIRLRITVNERSNYTLLPIGNKRTTRVSMKKPLAQTKVVRIKLTGRLLTRVQKAKGRYVVIAIRVVGIDANKNIVRKTIRLRVLR